MVVGVDPIRDAPETAELFETLNGSRLDDVARAIDFGLIGPGVAQLRELFVDRLFELLSCVSRPRRRLKLEHRAERQRVLLRLDVLRDLLFVDQLLVQAARSAAAQDGRRDVGVGITRREEWRRDP